MCSEAHKHVSACLLPLFRVHEIACSEGHLSILGAELLHRRQELADAAEAAEGPLQDAVGDFRQTRSSRGPVTLFGQTFQSAHELGWAMSLQVATALRSKRLTLKTVDAAYRVLEPYGLTSEGLGKLAAEIDWEAEEVERLNNGDGQVKSESIVASRDFATVAWGDKDFVFTKTQAACVKPLMEDWERGVPELKEETILDEAGSAGKRLRDVFDKGNHSAWGTMIVKGKREGLFRIADPEIS